MVDQAKVNTNSTQDKAITVDVPPGKMAAAVATPAKSSINWAAIIGGGLVIINFGLSATGRNPISIDPQTQLEIASGLGVVMAGFIALKRTFWHDSSA